MKINCIIIDDDPLAAMVLQELIEKTSFLNLLRTYPSAKEAIFKKEEISELTLNELRSVWGFLRKVN